MNFNNYTIRSQEAVQQAFMLARDRQHQAVETGHLLKALLGSEDGVAMHLLGKNGVNTGDVDRVLERVLDSYPKVTGGEQYLSSNTNKALQKALEFSKSMNDQFISVEHLLLGLVAAGDQTSQLMKDIGVTEKGLGSSISELRKGSKVQSQTAEE